MNARSRLMGCAALVLVPIVPIGIRLSDLQVLQRQKLTSLASEELRRESIEILPRGRILDRSGKVLAQSLPSWSIFMDPLGVRKPEQTARQLATVLKIPQSEILRKARMKTHFVWLKRKLTLQELQAVNSLHLQGIASVATQQRYYPSGDLARGLLGSVGMDGNGLSGLELAFNKQLTQDPLKLHFIRDGSGKNMMATPSVKLNPPEDLTLTLDRSIQHYAENALMEGINKHAPQKATVLVQDPRTGDILALANYPADPLRNPAIQDTFEPGSTFKLITMAAALEERSAHWGDRIDGEGGRWSLTPSVAIRDHEPEGIMTLPETMEKSSNIALAKLGLALGEKKLYRYSRLFGFGSKTGLPMPGESAGILKDPSTVTQIVLANNAFGQGLAVSPIQLLCAYSAIANNGLLLEPRLISNIQDQPVSDPTPIRRVLSERTVRMIQIMLEGVVERGTGINAAVPGYWVAGKTGTAQKIDTATGKYSPKDYIASFVGYAPARNPQFTILVIMDSPKNQYYGSDVAAPIFAKLMRQILASRGIPPERPLDEPRETLVRSKADPSDRSGRLGNP